MQKAESPTEMPYPLKKTTKTVEILQLVDLSQNLSN